MKILSNTILKVILIYISLFVYNQSETRLIKTNMKKGVPSFILNKSADADKVIEAMSYNVWGLPIWIPGQNQSNRFKKIPDSLLSRDLEIICLQEVFNTKIRLELINKMSPHFFLGSDYDCKKPIIGHIVQKDCYGGLMTLSKYPIIAERFYSFSNTSTTSFIEKIGSKGFLFTTIVRNGQPINIINTHLYAGNSQHAASNRMNQILEMEEIISGLEEFYAYPTILFGDLNITHPFLINFDHVFQSSHAYEYITQKMNFIDNSKILDECSYTINSDLNIYCEFSLEKQKLDYIMIHRPSRYKGQIWLSDQKIDFFDKSALSDHMGWKAKINVSSSINTTTKTLKATSSIDI